VPSVRGKLVVVEVWCWKGQELEFRSVFGISVQDVRLLVRICSFSLFVWCSPFTGVSIVIYPIGDEEKLRN